jgi:hypothetical protein
LFYIAFSNLEVANWRKDGKRRKEKLNQTKKLQASILIKIWSNNLSIDIYKDDPTSSKERMRDKNFV